MNIKEIVETFLKLNRYDGLCDPDIECGCSVDDLAPCGEIGNYCETAELKEDGLYYPKN